MEDSKIVFAADDGEKVEFNVVEQTTLNGINYLLVTEDNNNDEEAEAYILKDISANDEEEAVYDMVEDEEELSLIAEIFEELLEDIDLV